MDPACSGGCSSRNPSSSRPTMKSARIRPVGVSSRERRACPWTRDATSVVTRSWSQPCASSPVTRIFRSADRSTNARPASRAASCSAGASSGPIDWDYLAVDVPRTLLVTNDYPPRVGGIQRTLEALVKELPPERVSVFCPDWDEADAFDRSVPYEVLRQPERFLWPTPDVGRRVQAAVEASGAEVVLFGATYPLAMLGPGLAARGTPYLAAAHGFEYWLSVAPGSHALMRYATSKAARVPVMCSEFIARTVRTAVPKRVPVSVLYPGADVEVVPARSAHRRPPGAPRDRRPSAGGVREPSGGAEGAGRADPRDGAPSTTRSGRHPADRGRRSLRGAPPRARRRRRRPTPSSSPDR